MTLEELNYKLTGIENPRYLTSDQKMVIEHCLVIINEIEQNSHKHSVMQAEGSDVSEGAAVASEGAREADMSGVELQPDEVCGCHYMTPVWAGSNQCMKCNKNRL